jgi:hypothetical protein
LHKLLQLCLNLLKIGPGGWISVYAGFKQRLELQQLLCIEALLQFVLGWPMQGAEAAHRVSKPANLW